MSDSPRALNHATFDVYGYRFALRSTMEEPFAGICQDFAFFRTPGETSSSTPVPVVDLRYEEPGYDRLPESEYLRCTPRNVVYRSGPVNYIDYQGRGLGIHDPDSGNFTVHSKDAGLLYETAYLYLLSQIGKELDARGIHRVHALALVIEQQALLVLLPMGGGKSTLGHDLLSDPRVRILSDDSPFIDPRGDLHAFPLRIGLLPGHEDEVPAAHRRTIQRMEFGPKLVVDYAYFAERVVPGAPPGLLLVGARSLSRECRLEPKGLLFGLRAMVANCIVGVGLFQGVEFILTRSPGEMLSLIRLGISRSWASFKLVRRSKVYRVWLGRDRALNARTILELIEQSRSAPYSAGK